MNGLAPPRLRVFALLLAGALAAACGATSAMDDQIVVDDRSAGCFDEQALHEVWRHIGDDFVGDRGRIPAHRVEALRSLLLASRTEPPELLRRLGFTPEALAAHPTVVRMFMTSEAWRRRHPHDGLRPPDEEARVAFAELAPLIRRRLVPLLNSSTTSHEFVATLPGNPRIEVRTRSGMPWMLPWRVTAGSERWEVADPDISLALLDLANPVGPSARLLDGRRYAQQGIWDDALIWASDPFDW